MPANPLVLVIIIALFFIIFSVLLSPFFNTGSRKKLLEKIDSIYDINKTKTEKSEGDKE